MTEPSWKVLAPFQTSNRHFADPHDILTDPAGVPITDKDGVILETWRDVPIARDEVIGARSFDNLVFGDLIDVNYITLTATILSGASQSATVPLDSRPVLWVIVPSGWDAAVLTVRVSMDGTNFYDLEDEAGNAVSLAAESGKALRIDKPDQWTGFPYLKFRSGTPSSPVTQTADRTITIRTRDA